MLYINGNFWHENKMRPHPPLVFQPLQAQTATAGAAFAADPGERCFRRMCRFWPVFGYHLGRLTPPFARTAIRRTAPMPPPTRAGCSCRSLCDAYIQHHRGSLLRVLRLASRVCDLVVVAPPVVQRDPATRRIAERITQYLTATRVRCLTRVPKQGCAMACRRICWPPMACMAMPPMAPRCCRAV